MDNSFSLEDILKKSLSIKNLTLNTSLSIFFFLTLTILTGIFYLCLSFLSSYYFLPLKLSSLFIIQYNPEALMIFTSLTAIYLFLVFLIHSIFQSFFLALAKIDFENHHFNPKKLLKQSLHKSKYILSTNFFWLAISFFFLIASFFLHQSAISETQVLNQSIYYLSFFLILLFSIYLLPFFLISFYQNFNEEKHAHIKRIFSLIKIDFSSSLTYSLFIIGAIFIFSFLFLSLSTIITASSLSLDSLSYPQEDFFFYFLSLFSYLIKLCSILILTIFIAWLYSFFSYASILLYHKRKYDSYTNTQKERTKRIIQKIRMT